MTRSLAVNRRSTCRTAIGLLPAIACAVGLEPAVNVQAADLHVPADHPTIQAAIDAAAHGDTVVIASGTYTENLLMSEKTVHLVGAKGAAATVIDGSAQDSVLHVVKATDPLMLTGLTLRNGRGPCVGGGIRLEGTAAVIQSCVLRDNVAQCDEPGTGYGGAIYTDATLSLLDSVVENNRVLGQPDDKPQAGSSGYGGGIWSSADLALVRTQLLGNTAQGVGTCGASGFDGGARSATLTAVDSIIRGNSASVGGACAGSGGAGTGGVHVLGEALLLRCTVRSNYSSAPNPGTGGVRAGTIELRDCLIAANGAVGNQYDGTSGVHADSGAMVGCTVTGNSFPPIFFGTGSVTNSIVWNNLSPGGCFADGGGIAGEVVYSYCLTAGMVPGMGNITGDPLFVDADGGDFRLRSDSPCVDAGTNDAVRVGQEIDLAGHPRVAFPTCGSTTDAGLPIVDMGCYEHPAEDAPSGELTGDCIVDGADVAVVLGAWGVVGAGLAADLNGDGVVDGEDLGLVLAGWNG